MGYRYIPFTSFQKLFEENKELPVVDPELFLNNRFRYLDEYVSHIGVKSVIIEDNYIDRDFMEDYCGHYARCFRDYPKKCTRFHFFSSHIDRDAIEALLTHGEDTDADTLQRSYLGFFVIRPVPKAELGKVCLAAYPAEEGKKRIFPLMKEYSVHLFGFELKVRSVAFQEQDKVISACATSALWSAFHGVRSKSTDTISSPFVITENGRKVLVSESSGNVLDKGLYPAQMASAIREEGLEPIMLEFRSISYTKALIRAYLNLGLPTILGVTLRYENEEGNARNGKSRKTPIGEHAVTVVGYNLNGREVKPFSLDKVINRNAAAEDIKLVSSAITKFYVHDDQVGPFASMTSRDEYWQLLETKWYEYSENPEKVNASPTAIFIPCYRKVRIRFATVWEIVSRLNGLFRPLLNGNATELIWDLKLTDINRLKQEIKDAPEVLYGDAQCKYDILSTNMPRFLWVAECFLMNADTVTDYPAIRYVFDATDMPNADLLVLAIHFNYQFYDMCVKKFKLLKDKYDLKEFTKVTTLKNISEEYLSEKFSGDKVRYHIHKRTTDEKI